MKLSLQRGLDPNTGETIWLILDEDYQLVEPIQRYLTYLSTSKSPNTVESYGYDLKAWWEFLSLKHLDWRVVELSDLENFAYWLRVGDTSKVVYMEPVKAKRTEKTINRAITTVSGFYEYHTANKTVDFKQFERFFMPVGISRTRFLQGISKSKPTRKKLVKLKESKKFPGCLTNEQVETLVNACHRLRDKLIILMLYGTGIRKGELLGLRHEDIGDCGDNTIRIVRRINPYSVRVKGQERVIPVNPELLQMYNNYLIYEYPEVESNYVFINIWSGEIGQPIHPKVINTIFSRLSKKTNIKVHPHLFRHTYATRLLKAGYSPDRVKHLLGHTSIKTTLDIYSHVVHENDLREVVKQEEYE
ncbi:putative integrase/recombinase [Calothrix sp. PCC 7716]|nr:putative integrase/recombinase [Calothrix sp. PCC 7716]BDA73846.1 putative integrase/recombinase [Calothrix sp. PCC 7716]